MIEEDGYSAALYDPIFHPDESVLARTYDFITCTETVEHFATPRADFLNAYTGLLVPGGWIGIMTDILEDREGFGDWYYHRDPTHVAFYSRRTFRWIADWLDLTLEHPQPARRPPSETGMRSTLPNPPLSALRPRWRVAQHLAPH